jgi:hypothetical protein
VAHIVLDTCAGRDGGREALEAAAIASLQLEHQITVVGDESDITAALQKIAHDAERLRVAHARDRCEPDLDPREVLARAPRNSVLVGLEIVARDPSAVLVSAGQPGLLVYAAQQMLGKIAQVHRATLADGRAVVLKIRRPGIRAVVEADLRLLGHLAAVAESEMPELRPYRPRKLVRAFARSLRDELDLAVEARNTEQLAQQLAARTDLVLPGVHDEWTGERLLVLDYLPGVSVARWLTDPAAAAVDGPALARSGADALLAMIFVDGFFHADPHPGNLLLLPDGRLGLIDCGMVGRLSEARRGEFRSTS